MLAEDVDVKDKKTLKLIAETSMISKSVSGSRENLADLAVKAVSSVAEQTGKASGTWTWTTSSSSRRPAGPSTTPSSSRVSSSTRSRCTPACPRRSRRPRSPCSTPPSRSRRPRSTPRSRSPIPSQMQAFLDEEENMLRKMVAIIKESGANVGLLPEGHRRPRPALPG